MMLENPINVNGCLVLATLFAHKFFHTVASGIIEIVCVNRWLPAVHLGAVNPHVIAVVPLEVPFGVLPDQVAVALKEMSLSNVRIIVANVREPIPGRIEPFPPHVEVSRP